MKSLSCVRLLATPRTAAHQAPPSMGIFQARVLEWVAIAFSKLSCFSCVQLTKTPWTVAFQAPLPMGFSWQQYWSGLPCPPPGGIFLTQGLNHISCVYCIAGIFFTAEPLGKPIFLNITSYKWNANQNRGKIPILINKNVNKYVVKSCANKCCNKHALLSNLYL